MLSRDLQKLLDWYRGSQRSLPWRENQDPYRVMVSEIMLQQTTVAAVIPKYERWMERFPNVQSLAEAPREEVLSLWSGLGYYQRARRLHEAARCLSELGFFPDKVEDWRALPGFGPYTSAAVTSICFGRPELAADTNVIRVLFRYYGIHKEASDRAGVREIGARSQESLELGDPGELNQALMELGALSCSVKKPECVTCPLRRGCLARRSEQGPESYPKRSKKKAVLRTPGLALVLTCSASGKLLLFRGTSLGLLKELFQPPLFFSQGEGELHDAIQGLVKLLEPQSCDDSWTLKYGISGRRLELDCRSWSVEAKEVESLLRSLDQGSWLWWEKGQDRSPPLSTLTRKALRLA